MNRQQAFDKAYKGVIKQGKPAIGELGNCLYRSGELKCNLGQLIPDKQYDRVMEDCLPFSKCPSDNEIGDTLIDKVFIKLGFNKNSYVFFSSLQKAHDSAANEADALSNSNRNFIASYKGNMKDFAKRFRLSSKVIK